MFRLHGFLIAIVLAATPIASAQSLTPLEVRSDAGVTSIDVELIGAVIEEGEIQLSAGTTTSPVLLDMQGASAISVSSELASTAMDLVLISPNGTIAAIVRNASPGSQNPVALSGAVAGVLQLAGGSASAGGFEPGGSVTHNILGNLPSSPE